MAGSPSVFVSYAHDSDQHRAMVWELAAFLGRRGIKVTLDRWSDDQRRDWYSWAIRGITEADFVLVVASPAYRRAGDGLGPADVHRGVQSESALLRDLLHGDRQTWLPRLLPVLLPGRGVDEIPAFLQPYTGSWFRVDAVTDAGAADLLRIITGQPSRATPVRLRPVLLDWQRKAYVNHDQLFGADELIAVVTQTLGDVRVDRVTSLVGDGGIGKTAIAYEAVRSVVAGGHFTRVAWASAADPHGVDGTVSEPGGAATFWVDILKNIGDQLGFDLGLSRALWAREFGHRVSELSSGERLLIVVDNLETLPDATGAVHQLRSLGILTPHCLFVTTRWELRPHLAEVAEYRVRPLGSADSVRLIRHLGLGNVDLSTATNSALEPILLITEGNPFLIRLAIQQYLSSHRPLNRILRDLRQLRDENDDAPGLADRVRSYLYTRSLTELERQHGEEPADALIASFCVKGRGDAFGYDELAAVSGIGDLDEFAAVLTAACQLSIVTSFGDPTGATLERNYTIHSLLYDFTCGLRC